MRKILKSFAKYVAGRPLVRRAVGNLIYPAVVEYLRDEVHADVVSPSGLVEELAWKIHAYLVLNEELRMTGQDCASDRMRCDAETRARIMDVASDRSADTEGDILEFGVHTGKSLVVLAEHFQDRCVYGFDSFDGLPDDWCGSPKGKFKTEPPLIKKHNVTLVSGLFEESVPRFLKEWSGRASLIHVDCVLYRSTMDCLLPILPCCQVGTVVLFDEYYNYPDFEKHEWLAWREIRAMYKLIAPCVAYDGRRAAFQIEDLGKLSEHRSST